MAATENAVQITTINGHTLLSLPEGHAAVAAVRQFVEWEREGGRSKTLIHLANMAFLKRCDLSKATEHSGYFQGISMLNFNLRETAWSRIITTLDGAGVFRTPDQSRAQFGEAMRVAELAEDSIIITPEDIREGDPFDEPPPERTRTQGQRARDTEPQAPTPGEAGLRFLHLSPIPSLISSRGPPMQLVARLAGALGPCLRHAQRRNESSTLRVVAKILATNIGRFLGADSATYEHPVLATALKPFLEATSLPTLLQGKDTSPSALTVEMSDGIRCASTPGGHAKLEHSSRHSATHMPTHTRGGRGHRVRRDTTRWSAEP